MPRSSPAASKGEGLRRQDRLRRRLDYQRCYQRGNRHHGRLFVLHVAPNELGRPRLGITVSRKVGGAVVRHRIKRRIKEIYRRWSERRRLPSVDLVVHVRPSAGASEFREVKEDLQRLLSRLLEPRPPAA